MVLSLDPGEEGESNLVPFPLGVCLKYKTIERSLFSNPIGLVYSHPFTVESQSQGLKKLAVTPSVLEMNMHVWSCVSGF